MAAVTATCVKCNKQFLIIDQEQQFLREKSLPNPTQCPECRQARRLELRGGRKLYRAKCSKCGKDIVTSYDPETATSPILCREDYDKWNAESDLMINEPLPDAPGQQATTLVEQPAQSQPPTEATPQPAPVAPQAPSTQDAAQSVAQDLSQMPQPTQVQQAPTETQAPVAQPAQSGTIQPGGGTVVMQDPNKPQG